MFNMVDHENEVSGQFTITAVIRARNAERDLGYCLAALRDQIVPAPWKLEIIVIDNESSDGTIDVAKKFGASVSSISCAEFSWGRALNRGISAANGQYVLIISADVEPIGINWLATMINSLQDNNAAAYGRQVPRASAPIDEVARLIKSFPPGDSIIHINDRAEERIFPFLSNACALIRKSAWDLVPFDEVSDGGEEHEWMARLIESGYSYVYVAGATAFHSHRDPFLRGAYRLWELHKQGLVRKGKKATLGNILYAAASITKRRFRNVFTVPASARSRIEGVIRLPAEVTAFLMVALLEEVGIERQAVRKLMWR